ncbi:MAG: hypothetical protein M5U26_08230 [Planctomycetota bacterium]|nr:hypothetical protein [Planctomycetota bacterium]
MPTLTVNRTPDPNPNPKTIVLIDARRMRLHRLRTGLSLARAAAILRVPSPVLKLIESGGAKMEQAQAHYLVSLYASLPSVN